MFALLLIMAIHKPFQLPLSIKFAI